MTVNELIMGYMERDGDLTRSFLKRDMDKTTLASGLEANAHKFKADLSAMVDTIIGESEAAEDNIYDTEEGRQLWKYLENRKAYRNELRTEQRKIKRKLFVEK